MAQQRQARPGDTTGRERDKQQQQVKEDSAKAEEEELARLIAEEEAKNKVIDVTQEGPPIEYEEAESDEEIEVQSSNAVEVVGDQEIQGATRTIRINSTISPTIGIDPNTLLPNTYHFEEGRRYKVPLNVAEHLDEKGYVWH